MVVQGATLVIRIIRAVFMLSTSLMSMMMVRMIDFAAATNVGSDILLVFESMLYMNSDQRHDPRSLDAQKEPQEQRTKTP
jgi:hypothetical protein